MSEFLPPFHFDRYTLRIALPADLRMAANWTEADPDHAGKSPWFWIYQSDNVNSLLLEDEQGPVFFFRMQIMTGVEIEVHIQFSPDDSMQARERVMRALLIGFAWLEIRLTQVGFRTMFFESKNPALILFCQKRMGFAWDGKRLERKMTHGEANHEETKLSA